MLEARAVTKTYGRAGRRIAAVHNLTLGVPAGECLAIAGPNGAGKSTLLSLILGAVRPTSGRLFVDGRAPRAFTRREGVGYLPERVRFPRGWTVEGTLIRLATLEGLTGGDRGRAVDAALDSAGLAGRRKQLVDTLSRGLARRLGIGQLLLAPRRLVLLDEPLSGLDAVWRMRFRDLLSDLRRRTPDAVVLVSSHELMEVERFADRALVMERGRAAEFLVVGASAPGTAISYAIRVSGPADLRSFLPRAKPDRGGWHVEESAERLAGPLSRFLQSGGVIETMTPVRRTLEQAILDVARTADRPAWESAKG